MAEKISQREFLRRYSRELSRNYSPAESPDSRESLETRRLPHVLIHEVPRALEENYDSFESGVGGGGFEIKNPMFGSNIRVLERVKPKKVLTPISRRVVSSPRRVLQIPKV